MSAACVVPLLIACVASWISLQEPEESKEELPQILGPIISIIAAIIFFIMAPWVIQLSLMVILLIVARVYLQQSYNLR